MKIEKVFKEFLSVLQSKFPDSFRDSVNESDYKTFELNFFIDIAAILQKNNSFFDRERIIFDGNLSSIWKELDELTQKKVWNNLQICAVHVFFNGDITEKFESVFSMVTPMLKTMDGYTDEIDSILGKEDTKNKFVNILEYIKDSKLLVLFIEIFETIDLSQISLEDELDIEKLQTDKAMVDLQNQIQKTLVDKLKSGEISQSDIAHDMQMILTKVQEIFGDSMNDMLGTRKGPAGKVALSNSPEARRARMVARLQRKLAEKK